MDEEGRGEGQRKRKAVLSGSDSLLHTMAKICRKDTELNIGKRDDIKAGLNLQWKMEYRVRQKFDSKVV